MPTPQSSSFLQKNFIIGVRRSGNNLEQETFSSVRELKNYYVLKGGSVKRRLGTVKVHEFANIDKPVKRFISVGEHFLILFSDGDLRFVYNNVAHVISVRPFHNLKYTIDALASPDSTSAEAYKLGDFDFHNVVSEITTDSHREIVDIISVGNKALLLPKNGLPFILDVVGNILSVRPYFFDDSSLTDYETMIRAFPFKHEPENFLDVLFDDDGTPNVNTDRVRLIVGRDADLNRGRCKVWLGVDKDFEDNVDKIDIDKMCLSDYIGRPLIFNIFPNNPEVIPLDFKRQIDTSDENKVKIVADKNWDLSTTYASTLLTNLNGKAKVSSFSFNPIVDEAGNITSSKAELIRELLYGRRYFIIPYNVHRGSYNSGDKARYLDVFPKATSDVAAKDSITAKFDNLKGSIVHVPDYTANKIRFTNYKLFETHPAQTPVLGNSIYSRLAGEDVSGDAREAGYHLYLKNSNNFNLRRNSLTRLFKGFSNTSESATHSRYIGGNYDVTDYLDLVFLSTYFSSSIHGRTDVPNINFLDVGAYSSGGFVLPKEISDQIKSYRGGAWLHIQFNQFSINGVSLVSKNIIENNLGTSVRLYQKRNIVTNGFYYSSNLRPEQKEVINYFDFALDFSDSFRAAPLILKRLFSLHSLTDAGIDEKFFTNPSAINWARALQSLIGDAGLSIGMKMVVDPREPVDFPTSAFRNGRTVSIQLRRSVPTDAALVGSKFISSGEADLGYTNPPVGNSIKVNVPEGFIANNIGDGLSGENIKESSWSTVVEENSWRSNFKGIYFTVPRNSEGEFDYDETKLSIFVSSFSGDLDLIDKILFEYRGNDYVFSDPERDITPSGQTGRVKTFSLISANASDLGSFMSSVMEADIASRAFTVEFRDSSDNVIDIDIVPFNESDVSVVGYSQKPINTLSDLSINPKGNVVISAAYSAIVDGSSKDAVAFGMKKIIDASGDTKFTYFLLIKKGVTLQSQSTLILVIDSVEHTLTKQTDTGLNEIEEYIETNPTSTEFIDIDSNKVIKIKLSDGSFYEFSAAQTGTRVSSVYADCAIFEIGMLSPSKNGDVRTIGGNDYDNKDSYAKQIYAAYKDDYTGLVSYNENLALLKDDKVFFAYNNDNRANNLIRILNGVNLRSPEILNLFSKSGYVPGLFERGQPPVITAYLRSDQSNVKDIAFDGVQANTLESYIFGRAFQNTALYSRTVRNPSGEAVVLNGGAASFDGSSVIVSSSSGIYLVSSNSSIPISLITSQKALFGQILVFNNRFAFITPDKLIAVLTQSEERRGIRVDFSGVYQADLMNKVTGIAYDRDRQLYLMATNDGKVVCSTDLDRFAGGFGEWEGKSTNTNKFDFLNIIYSNGQVKALCRESRPNTNLIVVVFDGEMAADYNGVSFDSIIESNSLSNSVLFQDSGLYKGSINLVEVSYADCEQIRVDFIANNKRIVSQNYIQKDVDGRLSYDIPPPLSNRPNLVNGYNPRIRIVQDGVDDIKGTIFNFKMKGKLDGLF